MQQRVSSYGNKIHVKRQSSRGQTQVGITRNGITYTCDLITNYEHNMQRVELHAAPIIL
jgi:hypothetical protein